MTNTLPATSSDAFGPLYYVAGVNSKTNSHIWKDTAIVFATTLLSTIHPHLQIAASSVTRSRTTGMAPSEERLT